MQNTSGMLPTRMHKLFSVSKSEFWLSSLKLSMLAECYGIDSFRKRLMVIEYSTYPIEFHFELNFFDFEMWVSKLDTIDTSAKQHFKLPGLQNFQQNQLALEICQLIFSQW